MRSTLVTSCFGLVNPILTRGKHEINTHYGEWHRQHNNSCLRRLQTMFLSEHIYDNMIFAGMPGQSRAQNKVHLRMFHVYECSM